MALIQFDWNAEEEETPGRHCMKRKSNEDTERRQPSASQIEKPQRKQPSATLPDSFQREQIKFCWIRQTVCIFHYDSPSSVIERAQAGILISHKKGI